MVLPHGAPTWCSQAEVIYSIIWYKEHIIVYPLSQFSTKLRYLILRSFSWFVHRKCTWLSQVITWILVTAQTMEWINSPISLSLLQNKGQHLGGRDGSLQASLSHSIRSCLKIKRKDLGWQVPNRGRDRPEPELPSGQSLKCGLWTDTSEVQALSLEAGPFCSKGWCLQKVFSGKRTWWLNYACMKTLRQSRQGNGTNGPSIRSCLRAACAAASKTQTLQVALCLCGWWEKSPQVCCSVVKRLKSIWRFVLL